jgi:hypothetical protein
MCFSIIGTTILPLPSHPSVDQKSSVYFAPLFFHHNKSSQRNALPYSVNTKLADVCFTFVISNDFLM